MRAVCAVLQTQEWAGGMYAVDTDEESSPRCISVPPLKNPFDTYLAFAVYTSELMSPRLPAFFLYFDSMPSALYHPAAL